MSERGQRILLWWSMVSAAIYFAAAGLLLHVLPTPSATWSAARIAQFYVEHSTEVKWGATITSWAGGYFVPLAVVVAVQISRHEKGKPLWSILAVVGCVMMSIFLVLPPLFMGVAAFTPSRAPEITATVHELAMLTFMATDQYYIFLWVAVTVICLTPNTIVYSPFPRWFGYLTISSALALEAGAIAFLTRTGPFAWNGILVFWVPMAMFGLWFVVLVVRLFKAIAQQSQDTEQQVAQPTRSDREPKGLPA